MKKFFTHLALLMTAATCLTACDMHDSNDRHEARTLDGTWTGYIETYFRDRYGWTGDNYRTTICFQRENPYGGWGYEVDYDYYNRYSDYYYCEFRWEVSLGTIRIQYDDSYNDVYIRDYSLDDYYFSGYMDDGTSRNIYFQLSYDRYFEWGYWTRGATRAATEGQGFKASGRFAEQR